MISSGVVDGPAEAAEHYAKQIQWLANVSTEVDKNSALTLTYGHLVQDPERAPPRLERFLELRTSIHSSYSTTP